MPIMALTAPTRIFGVGGPASAAASWSAWTPTADGVPVSARSRLRSLISTGSGRSADDGLKTTAGDAETADAIAGTDQG